MAGEYSVEEKTEATLYLDYTAGVLTVHGQMDLKNLPFRIDGDVTFTGGGDSCLETGSTFLAGGTLTLSSSAGFKPQVLNGNMSASPVTKLTTTNDYSGDIAIQKTSSLVLLDAQSSASISLKGMVTCNTSPAPDAPMSLISSGDITVLAMLQYHTATVKGKNISLISHSPAFDGKSLTVQAEQDVTIESQSPAIIGAAEVSAGGNVTISGSIPAKAFGSAGSLTVKNAKSMSIRGKTNAENSTIAECLSVPVTFENCGNITVTDAGTEEILKEGVTVTSDKPWAATTGGKTVTMPSGRLTYGGSIENTLNDGRYVINSTDPIIYDTGEGKIFYEPAAAGGAAMLTLDGASFDRALFIQPGTVPLRLELKGDNQRVEINTTPSLTLTGTGSFTGKLLVTEGFTNNFTGKLNVVVGVAGRGSSNYTYTVYGERSTSDCSFRPTAGTPLTIAEGAVLTVNGDGEVVLDNSGGTSLINKGTIINNHKITIIAAENAEDADISAFIKGLKLTGTGSVSVKKGNTPDGHTDTYTNSGVKFLEQPGKGGALDLSSADADDADNWDTQGYKWEVTKGQDESGNEIITSATLTLAPGFNATSVTLPDTAVTIVATGESRIGELIGNDANGSGPQKTALTFSGTGPLIIDKQINIAGGDNNSLTVAQNANVIAKGGIYIDASSGVNSIITVYGTLTATAESGAVIHAGSVAIGNTGVLNVSGEEGVLLSGMPKNTGAKYNNLFSVTGDGRFTANCSNYNIRVDATDVNEFPQDSEGNTNPKAVINLGSEYMPDDCELRVTNTLAPMIDLFRISKNAVYSGPLTIHRNHSWSTAWTDGGGDTHHHACIYQGCTAKKDELPHFYAHGATACRDCGHTRPDGTPDSSPGGSGGSGGSSGGSGGGYKDCPQDSTCPIWPFADADPTAWYHDGVHYCLENSLMSGFGNGAFGPGQPITRAQLVQILHNREGRPPVNYLMQFKDVPGGVWYTEAVRWAASQGVVNGYNRYKFGPDDNITREQLAVMLWRYAGSPGATDNLHFRDAEKISGYALEALRWAVGQDIMQGKGDGILDPKGTATRAEAAAMLMRFLGK